MVLSNTKTLECSFCEYYQITSKNQTVAFTYVFPKDVVRYLTNSWNCAWNLCMVLKTISMVFWVVSLISFWSIYFCGYVLGYTSPLQRWIPHTIYVFSNSLLNETFLLLLLFLLSDMRGPSSFRRALLVLDLILSVVRTTRASLYLSFWLVVWQI